MLAAPVGDETGLAGAYDFKLDWVPEASESGGRKGLALDWIFAVLPQQLGLRLEGRKVPLEFLIVDGARKPSAD